MSKYCFTCGGQGLVDCVCPECGHAPAGSSSIEAKRTQTAIEVVQDLYQFSKVEDLDKNMLKIRNLTTQSVYNQLTVDNEERTLNTYLKFKGDATSVNVVKATSSYILYTLTNKNIDKDRVFIFMYDCNSKGKLSNVRESECLDFLK